jgi:hypothetical protein
MKKNDLIKPSPEKRLPHCGHLIEWPAATATRNRPAGRCLLVMAISTVLWFSYRAHWLGFG